MTVKYCQSKSLWKVNAENHYIANRSAINEPCKLYFKIIVTVLIIVTIIVIRLKKCHINFHLNFVTKLKNNIY